jgi:hypothetical protein
VTTSLYVLAFSVEAAHFSPPHGGFRTGVCVVKWWGNGRFRVSCFCRSSSASRICLINDGNWGVMRVNRRSRPVMQRKLRRGHSSVALIALIVASCGKAPPPGAATLEAWAKFKSCVTSVIDKPEYAALSVHTLDLDTMRPAPAELADETIPSAEEARLFAARFDEVNPCRENFLREVTIARPDLAPVLADEFRAAGVISVLVVDRRVTWAEAARRAQALSSDVRKKILAADLEWTADIIPFHQPDMAQIRAAAAHSQ